MQKKTSLFTIVAIVIICLLFGGCSNNGAQKKTTLKSKSRSINVEGLSNFHKVSDTLYRSAQPEEEGVADLKKRGIKTVVNLRTHDSDREMLKNTGIIYVHLPVSAFKPKKKYFTQFLKIVQDPARQPVLVHCRYGADRTGTAVALYRIFVEGWDREEAVYEMTEGGFGFHLIHRSLKDFVREFEYSAKIVEAEESKTR